MFNSSYTLRSIQITIVEFLHRQARSNISWLQVQVVSVATVPIYVHVLEGVLIGLGLIIVPASIFIWDLTIENDTDMYSSTVCYLYVFARLKSI